MQKHGIRACQHVPLKKFVCYLMLLTLCFLFFPIKIHAQNSNFTISRSNVSIQSVIKYVEQSSNYKFFYNDNTVNVDDNVNIDVKNASIETLLNNLFKSTNISYTIEGRRILLIKKEQKSRANQSVGRKTISGFVKDTNDEPIIGANVLVKGTTLGTITDINGRFILEIPANAELIVSYLGYVNQTLPVNGKSDLKIVLKEDSKILDEVVVVGYETQKKVNLTGAVSAVKGDVLKNRPIANLGQGLQGAIPNLQITQSNYAPGQGASFNVRGLTSLNGGDPLILIDGVAADPNLLNPDDVESVSVLKDAASAAIYGSQAAYGVILITTKHGKTQQKPVLNVSTSYSVTESTNIPEYSDSWQYVNYMNTASVNAGGSNYFDDRTMSYVKKYYDDPKNNLPVYYDPTIDTDGKYNYCGNTNWAKELYKSGSIGQINANLSGGTDKYKYYVSYGYMKQNGFLRSYDDQYQRHNINISLDIDVLKWLSVSTRTKYTFSNEDHPSGGSNGWSGLSAYSGQLKGDLRPLMPIKHPDGNWAGQGDFTNPFAVGAEGGYDRRKVNDLWLTGAVDIHPFDGLSIKGDFTYNPYSWNRDRTSRLFKEYWAAPGKYDIYPWVNPNSADLENTNNYYTALNAYIDFSKTFGKHTFKILAGYNQETKNLKWFYAKRENLINNDMPSLNLATGQQYMSETNTSWATQGVFSRIKYDYANKYLLEINSRYDGSSKFPKHDRRSFFPSISAAWRMSEENFWKGVKPIINDAKLRISYGSLGNQNVSGNFPYISNYNVNTSMDYILGGTLPVGISSGSLVSPSFTWEKVYQQNIGLDLQMIDNKLSFSLDVYKRKTNGMLTSGEPLPAVLGTDVPNENAADLKTYGWESTIGWKDKIGDVSYDLSFNMSDAQSKITKFSNPTGDLSTYYVGEKIGEIWGYESNGLFQSTEEVSSSPSQSVLYGGTWNPGDVKYVDLDGDSKITYGTNTLSNHGDKKIIGNNTPRYQFGFQAHAEWKGIDLTLFFQGTAKRDLWTNDSRFFGIGNEWDVPMKKSLDYWTADNTGAYLPRPYINGSHGNWEVSTRYLQNAAYIRLKQLSLGYTIPSMWIKKAGINNARIYFTGQNLLTMTKLSKLYDPENFSIMNYPVPKSYSIGLNLTF